MNAQRRRLVGMNGNKKREQRNRELMMVVKQERERNQLGQGPEDKRKKRGQIGSTAKGNERDKCHHIADSLPGRVARYML